MAFELYSYWLRMKKIVIFIIIIFCQVMILLAQEDNLIPKQTDDLVAGEIEKNSEESSEEESEDQTESTNTSDDKLNLDMQFLYGQYNHMDSGINISMEHEDFVYLLSTDFKRSNDYGFEDNIYENSGYYQNKFEFTGNFILPSDWTAISDIVIDNDSRGMFSNSDYSREDRDKMLLKTRFVKKFTPKFEAYGTINYIDYHQRLVPEQGVSLYKSNLNSVELDTGGELIWSSVNRLKYDTQFIYYYYDNDDADIHFSGQLIDDFRIYNYFGFSIGLNFAYNRDGDFLGYKAGKLFIPVAPIAGFSLKGLNYTSLSVLYKYDLEPFRAEELYFQQNFLYPLYDADPSKVHNLTYNIDFKYKEKYSINISGSLKKYDNYLSFYPIASVNSGGSGDVLSLTSFEALITENSFKTEIVIIKDVFSLMGEYRFFYAFSDKNVIYQPSNSASLTIKYSTEKFIVEWTNSFYGEVYTNIENENTMDRYFLGELNIQLLTVESFYMFLKIENLYNQEYYFRDGYPQAGANILFGLRLIK